MEHKLSKITLAVLSATAITMASPVYAQETGATEDGDVEVIAVSGIRSSLSAALFEKRNADSLV